MDEASVRAALSDLPLSGLRVFPRLGSTNDEALAWVALGAPDAALVVADEQTAGRGRSGRRWYTPAGTGLAFSLILRPSLSEEASASRLAGLGCLAVVDALKDLGLSPRIKWPNDVLVGGRKVAGILAESVWNGMELSASVVGIGINATLGSLPAASELAYPATAVEQELKRAPNRVELLRATLSALLQWRRRLSSAEFMTAWEERLAFRGEQVIITREGRQSLEGTLVGLDADGSLQLRMDQKTVRVQAGDVGLRPGSDRIH